MRRSLQRAGNVFLLKSIEQCQPTIGVRINSNTFSDTDAILSRCNSTPFTYAYKFEDRHCRPPPPSPPAKLVVVDRETQNIMTQQQMALTTAQASLQAANSFHAPARHTHDPRKTRTIRQNTTSGSNILALQLSSTPNVSILLLPKKVPANALMTAHTAASAHSHWRVVATSVALPATITIPCHASELDSRLLQVCLYGGRGGIGDFVIPVRTVLGSAACVGVGKKSVLDVRGIVGCYSGWGLGVGIYGEMSVCKDVRGCLVRGRRVGGGRADVALGQWDFGREGRCRMKIVGEVLWFGIEKGDGSVVRLVFDVVKKSRFVGEEIVGQLQMGLEEVGRMNEGDELKVGWWRGGTAVIFLAVVEMRRRSMGEILIKLRLTR